jgi:hypothetical protein
MTATLAETINELIVPGEPIARVEDGDSRWYYHPTTQAKYISVTTVISMSNAKPWLVPWAAKSAAEFAVLHRQAWGKIRATEGDQAAIRLIKQAAAKQRDLKAELGTFWHDVIERLVLDSPLPDVPEHLEGRVVDWGGEPVLIGREWLDVVADGFLQFVTDFEVEFIAAEGTVASDAHQAAGTLDMMGRLRCFNDRPLLLGDTKSGKNLSTDAIAQLGALDAFPHMWLRDGRIVRKPNADMAGVLHLRPEYSSGYKFLPVTGAELAAGWAWWEASLANVRAAEAMPDRFGHALYPPLPDGSQPPPMVEDLRSYAGCSRAVLPLLDAEFGWLADVALLSREDVLAIKGVGEKTVDALAAVLAEFGLSFASDQKVA